jgi:hypothetical protein
MDYTIFTTKYGSEISQPRHKVHRLESDNMQIDDEIVSPRKNLKRTDSRVVQEAQTVDFTDKNIRAKFPNLDTKYTLTQKLP